jgi:integrase
MEENAMASITLRPGGRYQVTFKAPNGKRQTIRLGAASEQQARTFKMRLEKLMIAVRLGDEVDPATLEWLLIVDDRYHKTLSKCGLVAKRGAKTIGELASWYVESKRKSCKPQTIVNIKRATAPLTKFFGEDRRLATIREQDADGFREWLRTSGAKNGGPLAPTTVSRTCRRSRQLFAAAIKLGSIRQNPFGEMRKWIETNPDRDVYVDRELVKKLIDATADPELRLIIALVRFAGLRCPSEIQPLQWSWVDWDAGCLQVASPKTEHHDGHARRLVPMFPDVRLQIDQLWESTPEGAALLFPRHQGSRTAITNRLQGLCRTIGIAMWAKPFVNMRASCERDWLKTRPIDEVAAWMGHSPTIALKHYNRAAAEGRARVAGTESASARLASAG